LGNGVAYAATRGEAWGFSSQAAGPFFRLTDERLLELREIVLETAIAISRDVNGKPDTRPRSEVE